MKTRTLVLIAASLVAISTPSIVANADDVAQSLGAGELPGLTPAMPDASFGAAAPAPALPAMPGTAPAITVAPVAIGGNPFQLASVSPMAVQPPPVALGNPFGAPTAIAAPTELPDAKPFSLLAPAPVANPLAPADQPANGIDVTALRYYASQRDMARVGAEIRRLKALYPDWEPPVDLFVAPSTVDEQPLWTLFAQGNYAAERARIVELKALNPTWQPSTDLMGKLEDAEARQAMRVAYNIGNWQQVVAVGQARTSMLVCSQVEALWQLGEALARLHNYALAFETYKYVLVNCGSPQDRLSTVQKASRLLPLVGVKALVVLGRPLPDGTSEFDSIGFDDLRHRISSAVNGEFDADPVDPSEVERFAAFVRATRSPDDVGLIGWYYYSQEQWDAARAWFALGAKLSRDPKFLEGQVLALREAGDIEPALKLANAMKGRSPELTKEYIELVSAVLTDPGSQLRLRAPEMETFETVVKQSRSALGAQAIGWTHVADGELNSASDWFDTSMEWEVTEGGVIGQAVVASRLKQYKTLSALKASYGDEYEGLEKFKVYTVKVKSKSSKRATAVTQASVECKDSKRTLGLFFVLACPSS